MKNLANINELLELISEGNEEAFRTLFDKYYSSLIGIALAYVNGVRNAEEVVSDVFFKLWQSRKVLAEVENIETYLFVSVKNQCYSYNKRYKRLDFSNDIGVDIEVKGFGVNPEEYMFTKELKEHIDRVVNSLPVRCKEIFCLAKVDGVKYKQISELLGLSIKTIDSQIAIATNKILKSISFHK